MAGADALCSQICAVLFTLAVREWITQANTEKNILSLLLHPRLGSVMQQMLEMPGHNWTVESLASIVHMSRASFAQLFREVSGTTPLAVLTKLRLQIAAQMFSRKRSRRGDCGVRRLCQRIILSQGLCSRVWLYSREYRESVRQLQEVKHE